jgi:poly-gamma-glutamate synthesis protein (capsule biosynthesis protein)
LRKLVEKGADFIVSQHSHCIGCFEYFKEGLIVYGQGNLLFDSNENNEFVSSGLLIELDTKRPRKEQFIPIIKNGSGVKLAKGNASGMILEGFFGRSEEILEEGLVEEKFEELARRKINEYLHCFSRLGNFSTLLTGMVMASFKGKRYKRRHLLKLQNTVRCEAHRELLLEGLKVLLEDYPE